MRQSVVLLGAFALFVFNGTGEVSVQGQAVPQDKIPKAVMDALLGRFPKASIDKCTKAKEGDDIVHDIEFKQDGRKCEADIKENGTFINYEKAIEADDLPRAVRSAIEKRHPKAILKEIMEEAKQSYKQNREFHRKLYELNASYTATPEEFTKILDDLNNNRRRTGAKILATRFKIKDMLTAEEWKTFTDNLNAARARYRHGHEAAEGKDGKKDSY